MTKKKVAPEFLRTRDFITRYSVVDDAEADVVTVWAMGTWCFSPMCKWPATFPYLYITGGAGSGKTVLGQDALGSVTRMWKSATGTTGPTLFRMLGRVDDETGVIENYAPTLCLDEIDATFSGSKDEPLRQGLNVGYKTGATIPRSAGKTSIDFPIYGPKIMMGIDNGHLPETVVQRSIRIELEKKTQDELDRLGVEPFYTFDVEEESAEIQQDLSDWAKAHSMVLRDYRPVAPKGLTARQWEIARTLVQLAHEIGIEDRIVKALITVFGRRREKSNAKERLYKSIAAAFNNQESQYSDRMTTAQLLSQLNADGVQVPGNSGKGLRNVLGEDGISPRMLRLPTGHPGIPEGGVDTQRGYFRYLFDEAFDRYLAEGEDD